MVSILIRNVPSRCARPGIAAKTNLSSEPWDASVARLLYSPHFSATAVYGGRRLVLPESLPPARIAPAATRKNIKLHSVSMFWKRSVSESLKPHLE
jgi:hypothetical protein